MCVAWTINIAIDKGGFVFMMRLSFAMCIWLIAVSEMYRSNMAVDHQISHYVDLCYPVLK